MIVKKEANIEEYYIGISLLYAERVAEKFRSDHFCISNHFTRAFDSTLLHEWGANGGTCAIKYAEVAMRIKIFNINVVFQR